MTDSSDERPVRLYLEMACGAVDEASAALLFKRFKRELAIRCPAGKVHTRREGPPPAEREAKPLPTSLPLGAVIHRLDDLRGDSKRQAGKQGAGKQEGFRTFTIPNCAWFACKCGYVWDGPADTAINSKGYLWNCPGCIAEIKEE